MKRSNTSCLLVALLVFLSSLCSGCETLKSKNLVIDNVSFRIVPIDFPYNLPEKKGALLKESPYNMELSLSRMGVILPFGVVCGNGDGKISGTYAEIVLEPDACSLFWMNERVLSYSFVGGDVRPRAYKLTKSNPDSPCGGDLAYHPIPLVEAACETITPGREQIVVFTPHELLIRKGNSKIFSCIGVVKSLNVESGL